ncbi:unnamed protein product [Rotaria socialis]|nr:unnamed protein product [Rotaria socialis]
MTQRTPQNGTRFASIWIGARLTNWSRVGTYDIVSHGPLLTTSSRYWCKQDSLLGQEPNYVALKETEERQACVGLACFKDSSVCLHDWFCSWKTYILCELHPPPPKTTTMMNNTGNSSRIWIYISIGGTLIILFPVCIVLFCCIRKKKNLIRRAPSFDSAESGFSQSSVQ